MEETKTLVCEACGFSQTYPISGLQKNGKAFNDGWDTEDWCGVTTCPKCSSAELMLGKLAQDDSPFRYGKKVRG